MADMADLASIIANQQNPVASYLAAYHGAQQLQQDQQARQMQVAQQQMLMALRQQQAQKAQEDDLNTRRYGALNLIRSSIAGAGQDASGQLSDFADDSTAPMDTGKLAKIVEQAKQAYGLSDADTSTLMGMGGTFWNAHQAQRKDDLQKWQTEHPPKEAQPTQHWNEGDTEYSRVTDENGNTRVVSAPRYRPASDTPGSAQLTPYADANGNPLAWDAKARRWVPAPPLPGGGAPVNTRAQEADQKRQERMGKAIQSRMDKMKDGTGGYLDDNMNPISGDQARSAATRQYYEDMGEAPPAEMTQGPPPPSGGSTLAPDKPPVPGAIKRRLKTGEEVWVVKVANGWQRVG